MIFFKNVTKIYSPKKGTKKVAIDNISFELPKNGLIFLIGKSGAGKSTLLNLLGILDKPTSGDILIKDKNICKFKEKELTSYRSNHIGFIFQEFNLLEDLNVYDNIDLSLNLKKVKSTKELLDKYLSIVGLNNLGLRKVSELSGGEKQRVAIARALIKNPTIILADEPTGNLDSVNSEQIFNILKHISKEHLVVVVSHDRESAYKYADGILEIADGKIINNTIHIEEHDNDKEFELSKSHISFFKRLKLAFGMLKKKKLRLVITILLLTIAFSLFGFSYSLMNFDIPRTHAESMVYEKEEDVIIKKGIVSEYRLYNMLTEEDLEKITSKIDSEYFQQSYLYVDNYKSKMSLGYNPKNEDLYDMAYYHPVLGEPTFIIYSKDKIKKLDIIGTIPDEAHEVLISQLLAERMVIRGFEIYNDTDKYMPQNYDIYVDSIDELLGKKVYISNSYVIISGIIKDKELSKYEELKKETIYKLEKRPTGLFEDFKSKYEKNVFNFVITEDFATKTMLSPNDNIDSTNFKMIYNFEEKEYYENAPLKILFNEVEVFDGTKEIKISNIKDNEIIISSYDMDVIFDYEPSKRIREALANAREEYNKEVQEREEKIKEQEEAMLNNPNYIPEEIPIVEEVDYEKITENVYKEFFKEKSLLNKEITIEIIDEYNILGETNLAKYTFKIVGLSWNGAINTYISKDYEKYTIPNLVVGTINIKESDQNKLEMLFRNFEDNDYKIETRFSSSMNNITKVVDSIEKISKYVTLGFMIFATILLTMFTTSNLSVNKRKIGILRALGAKTSDITKIFVLESGIIGLFTLILSSIGTIISVEVANNYITKELFFYARPIIFNTDSIISIFLMVLITILISSILPIIKISKTKPINLIQSLN